MVTSFLLRDVTEHDLAAFFEHQQDSEAIQMAAFPVRDHDAFMAHWAGILGDETVINKTIVVDGEVAGYVASFSRSNQRQVGYWIGKKFWGQGIATRALSAFLHLEKARPLYAYVAKHNLASTRVLEKCAFTLCGEDKNPAATGGEPVEEFVFRLE